MFYRNTKSANPAKRRGFWHPAVDSAWFFGFFADPAANEFEEKRRNLRPLPGRIKIPFPP
jgi:hypothetical protein